MCHEDTHMLHNVTAVHVGSGELLLILSKNAVYVGMVLEV